MDQDFSQFETGKAAIKSNTEFLTWLHDLTVAGYSRNIVLETEHEDAILGIYVLGKNDSLDKCLDHYLDFKRRWKALQQL
jgi:hypothetical protein